MSRIRHRCLFHLGLTAVALVALSRTPDVSAAARVVEVPGRSSSARYADAIGDSGHEPDIAAVEVSNDDDGSIKYVVDVANRQQLLSGDYLLIPIDTDGSRSSGEQGFEWKLDYSDAGAKLFRWDPAASKYFLAPGVPQATFSAGRLTITIGFRWIKAVGRTTFWVYADSKSSFGDGVYDFAPDGAEVYDHNLAVPLVLEELSSPRRAKAGEMVTAVATFLTNSDARPRVTCRGQYGTARVRGAPATVAVLVLPPREGEIIRPVIGQKVMVFCEWRMPKTGGKTFVGVIRAEKGAITFTRVVRVAVRPAAASSKSRSKPRRRSAR